MAGASPAAVEDARPSAAHLLSFSTTNFGKSLIWSVSDIFCLVYATDTLGLSPALAGTLILVSLIWDAITDPLVGAFIDKHDRLFGSLGAALRWAAPICSCFLVLLFAMHAVGHSMPAVAFLMALLLFRTAFTFVDVPDNALLSRVTDNRKARIWTVSLRKLLATAGATCISLASAWVFHDGGQLSEGTRIMVVAALAGTAGSWALIFGSWAVRQWDSKPVNRTAPSMSSSFSAMRERHILSLAIHLMLATLGIAFFMASLVYHARFIIGHDIWFAQAMTTLLVMQAVGVLFWGWLAFKLSPVFALCLATCMAVLSAGAFVFVRQETYLVISCGLFGFASGGVNALRWVIAPAVIDLAEVGLGHRYDATAMALFSLSIKSAIGFAAVGLGVLLSLTNYEPGGIANEQQAAAFTASLIIVVAVSMMLSLIPLTRSYIREI